MELESMTALELAAKIRQREVNVLDGVKEVFDQIESKEDKVHAYLDTYKKEAYARAKEVEKGIQDGTYTGTAECTPDADADFDEYNLSLSVTIKDGKIESITDIVGDGSKKNISYIEDAVDGVVPKIVAINGTDGIDAVSEATCSSNC